VFAALLLVRDPRLPRANINRCLGKPAGPRHQVVQRRPTNESSDRRRRS
jgi:hypothetical protein